MASQHLWTFERVPVNKELLTGTVPVNKELLTGTDPVNKELLTGTVPVNKKLLTGILRSITSSRNKSRKGISNES